jgi:hypothetical protein
MQAHCCTVRARSGHDSGTLVCRVRVTVRMACGLSVVCECVILRSYFELNCNT